MKSFDASDVQWLVVKTGSIGGSMSGRRVKLRCLPNIDGVSTSGLGKELLGALADERDGDGQSVVWTDSLKFGKEAFPQICNSVCGIIDGRTDQPTQTILRSLLAAVIGQRETTSVDLTAGLVTSLAPLLLSATDTKLEWLVTCRETLSKSIESEKIAYGHDVSQSSGDENTAAFYGEESTRLLDLIRHRSNTDHLALCETLYKMLECVERCEKLIKDDNTTKTRIWQSERRTLRGHLDKTRKTILPEGAVGSGHDFTEAELELSIATLDQIRQYVRDMTTTGAEAEDADIVKYVISRKKNFDERRAKLDINTPAEPSAPASITHSTRDDGDRESQAEAPQAANTAHTSIPRQGPKGRGTKKRFKPKAVQQPSIARHPTSFSYSGGPLYVEPSTSASAPESAPDHCAEQWQMVGKRGKTTRPFSSPDRSAVDATAGSSSDCAGPISATEDNVPFASFESMGDGTLATAKYAALDEPRGRVSNTEMATTCHADKSDPMSSPIIDLNVETMTQPLSPAAADLSQSPMHQQDERWRSDKTDVEAHCPLPILSQDCELLDLTVGPTTAGPTTDYSPCIGFVPETSRRPTQPEDTSRPKDRHECYSIPRKPSWLKFGDFKEPEPEEGSDLREPDSDEGKEAAYPRVTDGRCSDDEVAAGREMRGPPKTEWRT